MAEKLINKDGVTKVFQQRLSVLKMVDTLWKISEACHHNDMTSVCDRASSGFEERHLDTGVKLTVDQMTHVLFNISILYP